MSFEAKTEGYHGEKERQREKEQSESPNFNCSGTCPACPFQSGDLPLIPLVILTFSASSGDTVVAMTTQSLCSQNLLYSCIEQMLT